MSSNPDVDYVLGVYAAHPELPRNALFDQLPAIIAAKDPTPSRVLTASGILAPSIALGLGVVLTARKHPLAGGIFMASGAGGLAFVLSLLIQGNAR